MWLESDRLEEPLADILGVKSPAERKRQGEKRRKPKEGPMTDDHYLLQFKSDTDPREEYILITSRKPEKWYELTDPAFKLTAAAVLGQIIEGDWAHFLEPREHRYWRKGLG